MKKILVFLIIIILCGCNNKADNNKNINTIIEEKSNILIGINYPITNIKNLDTQIESDIQQIYNNFKKEYEEFNNLNEKSELNIDYKLDIVNDRFINIQIYNFIDSSTLDNSINYIKTYLYDYKKNSFLSIKDIISKDNLSDLDKKVKIELWKNYGECLLLNKLNSKTSLNYSSYNLFTIDNDYLNIYFNPDEIASNNCGIISIKLPLNKLKLKIELEKQEEIVINQNINIPNKVIDPNKKVIALTFDDGPSKYTNEIIEILKENDANATFFVLGNKVEIYAETIKKSLSYGNEIGNHSYNHKWLAKLSQKEVTEQINKTQEIIKTYTGYTPKLIRPTYGNVNNNIRNASDLDIVLWTVDTMDWKYKNVNTIIKRATSKVKDGDIILMHDIHKRTMLALKKIIPILKEQGYEFVTVSELKEIQLLRNNS